MASLNHDDRPTGEGCERVHEIVERELLLEVEPTATERDLVERHSASCDECAALTRTLDLIAEPAELPATEAGPAAPKLPADWQPATDRRRWIGGGLVAAAVAAAAVMLVVLSTGEAPETDRPPTRAGAPTETTAAPAPLLALTLDGVADEALVEGQHVQAADETLMLRAAPELAVGLDRASELALTALRTDRVELGLERGRLAVQLDPDAEIGLTVKTAQAKVVVTGTVFGVSIADDDVRVVVVAGAVRVESKTIPGGALVVREGQTVSLNERQPADLEQGERSEILALLELESPALREEPVAIVERQPETDTARIMPTPPDAPTGNGTVKGTPDQVEPAAEAAPAIPTADELIRAAREQRRNRNWHGAAEAYRQLLKLHPSRPEALTVLVPLAEIELEQLGRPDLALRHYGSYQRRQPGGALAEEAAFGKCAALKALGWRDKEAKALGEFLARYPGSVHTPNVKSRLQSISDNMD